jgi:RNA polymerase sigma-70 factor (ECF subfamily)
VDNATVRDALLVVRCQIGERAAFHALIARWARPLHDFVRRSGGDHADLADVTQEIWIKVLRRIHKLENAEQFRSWLFTIAHRTVMDRFRKLYAEPQFDDVDLAEPIDECPATIDEAELAALDREMLRLPRRAREVLTLFYIEELSLAEVAAILSVPVGTVKSRLFNGRKLLRNNIVSTLTQGEA